MQRNANIEQTSEINRDFFVISQRVKQIFAVYCKYAKKSKKSAFLQILWVSLQKCSPQSVPRINFCPLTKLYNALYIKNLQGYKWALKNILHRQIRRDCNSRMRIIGQYGFRAVSQMTQP